MIDETTELGARAARHLREDVVVWMTTVTPSGAPLPSPVWFVWDGSGEVVLYSMESPRIRNLEHNPRTSLNFDGYRRGGDVVILAGTAAIARGQLPPADENPSYLDKYRERMTRLSGSPRAFAEQYGVPVRIRLTRLRGF